MADWANITRNAKIHGDFAGRSTREQDAYFEFFAGSEPSILETTFVSVFWVFAKVQSIRIAWGLRLLVGGLASTKSTTSP